MGSAIDYTIDGQHRRVGKTVTTLTGAVVSKEAFVYRDQLQPAAWLNSDGSTKALFVYGLKPNVPEYMVMAGVEYRLVTDQLGSVRLVLDANGNPVERIDYDEFGRVASDTAPGLQPFGFAGGLRDPVTSLTRMGVRDLDSFAGTWTAKDPAQFAAGINFYEYSSGDPVNLNDVTGLDPGQRFSGPDARNRAAVDALLWVWRQHVPAVGPPPVQEWGGNMCKLDGLDTYFCTQPGAGVPGRLGIDPDTFNMCPAGSSQAGDYHMHPYELEPKPESRFPFSTGDIDNLWRRGGFPGYVATPTQNGPAIYMFTPFVNRSQRIYP